MCVCVRVWWTSRDGLQILDALVVTVLLLLLLLEEVGGTVHAILERIDWQF